MKNTLIALVITLLGIATAYVAFAIILPTLTKVESATNLPAVEWLPAASNISFAQSYNWRYFEFDISEPEFIEWANHYSLREITAPIQIPRYTRVLDNPSVALDMENDPQYTAFVTNGLMDSHTAQSGRGYIIAFDRNRNRGYFKSASR